MGGAKRRGERRDPMKTNRLRLRATRFHRVLSARALAGYAGQPIDAISVHWRAPRACRARRSYVELRVFVTAQKMCL